MNKDDNWGPDQRATRRISRQHCSDGNRTWVYPPPMANLRDNYGFVALCVSQSSLIVTIEIEPTPLLVELTLTENQTLFLSKSKKLSHVNWHCSMHE